MKQQTLRLVGEIIAILAVKLGEKLLEKLESLEGDEDDCKKVN